MSAPLKPSVLQGVPLEGERRLLSRREAEQLKMANREPAKPVPASVPSNRVPEPPKENPSRVIEEARTLGFKEGYEAGFREGIDEGRKKGFERGIEEGREKGTEDGLRLTQLGRAELDERIQLLENLLTGLPERIQQQIEGRLWDCENEMVALCHAIICRLFGDRALSPEMTRHHIREAIEQCSGKGQRTSLAGLLSVHVHPRDLEMLQGDPEFREWFASHRVSANPWIGDEQVKLGGCIVHSTSGSLDARLETQLAALKEILLQRGETPGAGVESGGGA